MIKKYFIVCVSLFTLALAAIACGAGSSAPAVPASSEQPVPTQILSLATQSVVATTAQPTQIAAAPAMANIPNAIKTANCFCLSHSQKVGRISNNKYAIASVGMMTRNARSIFVL